MSARPIAARTRFGAVKTVAWDSPVAYECICRSRPETVRVWAIRTGLGTHPTVRTGVLNLVDGR